MSYCGVVLFQSSYSFSGQAKHIIFYFYMASKVTTALSDFEVIALLGTGSFAQVFKVKRKQDSQIYALKKIRITKIKEKDRHNALNQIRILASEGGPNVIAFKEAFYDEATSYLCIIMEFAEKGDLLKNIQTHAKRHQQVKQEQIWKALVHITSGLKSLHDKKILHRDLKGANVFITGEGVYKLGDLNVSKVIKHDLARTQTGTPYYASPEVWKDLPYGTKSDMWSLGCVIYEMAAQRPPFTASDVQTLYKKVMSGRYPRIPCIYSNQLANIIDSLLRLNPQDRPSASQILHNPIVSSHFCDYLKGDDWQKDQLLSTIKFPENRNYKLINQRLPRAQYQKRNKCLDSKQQTIFRSFFKENQWKPKPPLEKEAIYDSKARVKSLYQHQDCTDRFRELPQNVMKRERIVSYAQSSKCKEESSINSIPIFRNTPGSQKLPKKTPQTDHLVKSPALSKNSSKVTTSLQQKNITQTCRKKVESVIQKIISSETSRGRNKENLRRIGEQIVSGGASRKDFSQEL